MKNKFQADELLKDVLDETASPDFRAELLHKTIQQAHRTKHFRRWNRAALTTCVLIAFGFVVSRMSLSPRKIIEAQHVADDLLVRSQPLPAQMLVRTEAGIAGVVNSSPSAVALIASAPAEKSFDLIGDEELLDIFAGKPVVLVHMNASNAELVFVNPQDQFGFTIH